MPDTLCGSSPLIITILGERLCCSHFMEVSNLDKVIEVLTGVRCDSKATKLYLEPIWLSINIDSMDTATPREVERLLNYYCPLHLTQGP